MREQLIVEDAHGLSLDVDADLLIGGATWDARCLSMTQFSMPDTFPHVMLLRYADKGSTGRVTEHEARLQQHFAPRSQSPIVNVDVDVKDLVGSWTATKAAVLGTYEAVRRPLRVILDLNSVPRYIALSLLGFGARTGVSSHCSVTYAAAAEYEESEKGLQFTSGSWRPRSIPTLSEGALPSARSLLVVSAGFEGAHTLRLVNALEPDRVIIAMTTGISDSHDAIARRANAPIAAEFLLDDEGVLFLPATDLKQALLSLEGGLSNISGPDGGTPALSFLLSGSKLGSLTVGLYSIDHSVAQVYYSDPERRLESSAKRVKWYTRVELRL